jgi:hypothetical protein
MLRLSRRLAPGPLADAVRGRPPEPPVLADGGCEPMQSPPFCAGV